MKAEQETERTFDRTSTREELCEVIDLICDTGEATPSEAPGSRRIVGRDPVAAFPPGLDYDFDEEFDDETAEETDELTATLSDLFRPPEVSWIN